MENALLIFIKNPELGKAKTRLAATLGKEKALEIYLKLLAHTRNIALESKAERHLFYSQFIDRTDPWDNKEFIKHLQNPNPNLGSKMLTSFEHLLNSGIKKALIIGSDCLELNATIVNSAFNNLGNHEAIIGPAKDGGYYSIGFNFEKLGKRAPSVLKDTFLNKTWSHENVCAEALATFDKHQLSYTQLPILSDVDVEEDIQAYLEKLKVLA
ncbi:TIGR04282 family arsenosugar biosynthesis glycosyltransferase [Arcticibacterium luteifluviistationis]|uniref:Glycosyltransferase n=1 Tax=Arcticibacterium luteifluviistationis TaxID=1784714 RepID=A0A2Z4GGI8_9BACT|nr:TIGR04282 family arsenosugar biosynthesis glycosyltransferase [Arcticibacterium luteifluviistationis]AWW00176.1 glycosyltransferase [Arcticibacterium luteifluviistationis]